MREMFQLSLSFHMEVGNLEGKELKHVTEHLAFVLFIGQSLIHFDRDICVCHGSGKGIITRS
jgi:hypothetical protein